MELDIGRTEMIREDGESAGAAENRTNSSFRMMYLAETKIFLNQYGNLENIRQKLGFSRRKMCQLLLVDPSAWTRWTKDESRVPPHIYRALEWFLALNEKALTNPDLAAIFTARYKAGLKNNDQNPGLFRAEIEGLKKDLKRQYLISLCLTAGLFMLGITLGLVLLQNW